jgi:hypothetical protein
VQPLRENQDNYPLSRPGRYQGGEARWLSIESILVIGRLNTALR